MTMRSAAHAILSFLPCGRAENKGDLELRKIIGESWAKDNVRARMQNGNVIIAALSEGF